MAVVLRKWIVAAFIACLLVLFAGRAQGIVHELNKVNFAKFIQGKFFTLTFVGSESCEKCAIAFPFFVAASRAFPHDPEIFFTRTNDPALVKEWGFTDLPVLIYHRPGKKNHELVTVDIKVDDIIGEISRILHGNFDGLTRIYTVEITDKNYDELIVTPQNSVLMLVHDKGEAREKEIMDKVAHTFRRDDAVIFATLDVTKYKKLRDEIMLSRDTPIFMWFPPDEKTNPKKFGGMLTYHLLIQFVNERTELNRDENGNLTPEAGRVSAADALLEENIASIIQGTPEDIKSVITAIEALLGKVERQHIVMLEYYLYILDNLAADREGKTVREILKKFQKILDDKEAVTTSQKDALARKKNIVQHFLNLERKFSEDLSPAGKDSPTEGSQQTDAEAATEREHAEVHEEL